MRGLLTFSLLVAGIALGNTAVAAPATGSCDSCSPAQLRQKAIDLATYFVSHDVHIADNDTRSVYHYDVRIDESSERYVVTVSSLPTDDPIDNLIRTHWAAQDRAAHDMTLPPTVNGMDTANASNLVVNSSNALAAQDSVAQAYYDLYMAYLRVNQVSATQVLTTWLNLPYWNNNKAIYVTVYLQSGSHFQMQISPYVDENGGVHFKADIIPGSLRGPDNAPIPTSRGGFGGYSYSGGNAGTLSELLQMAQALGIPVSTSSGGSSSSKTFKCNDQGCVQIN